MTESFFFTLYVLQVWGEIKVRRKLVVLFLALLMTSTAIVGIFNHRNGTINIASAAEGSNGGGNGLNYKPIVNYSYVWKKTAILSDIVTHRNCSKGRAFGTKGEQEAAGLIQDWMNETLGSENVKRDEIKEKWNKWLPWRLWIRGFGKMNKVRKIDKHWINITVIDKKTQNVVEHWNLSFNDIEHLCFPFLKHPLRCNKRLKWCPEKKKFILYYYADERNLNVTDCAWNSSNGKKCLILHAHWKDPYGWGNASTMIALNLPKVRAFILVDYDFNDTFFMSPPYPMNYPKPGFSINGSIGRKIENYSTNESYEVKARIYSEWHYDYVKSYNVIGELPGRNSSKVDIICAHYDCWWNQGAIDEAAETALVLGIAKYMKKLEEEKGIKPEHTVKFVAFAGEEFGFRGSKDYIVKYIDKGNEKVRFVINPGNFGHIDTKDITEEDLNGEERGFMLCAGKSGFPPWDGEWLRKLALNVAESVDYDNYIKRIINEIYGGKPWKANPSTSIKGEDADAFYHTRACEYAVQFSREPTFRGYHRDGANHSKGDVLKPNEPFTGLNNDTFTIESDIVLLTALYLCYEDVIKENLTILDCYNKTFDSGNDGRDDTVIIYFNVSSVIPTGAKIRVDLFYANNSNNSNDSLTHTYTRYFLIGENGTAHGGIALSPPSTESPGQYKARLRLYDVNGTLVDEAWTESFFLNLLDVPIANSTYTPSNPTDIENITFDAENHSFPSASENGSYPDIVNYTWNFGDGSYEYGGMVTHRYADDGYYNVTLTIIDTNGKNASITKQIYVRNVPPEVDFTISPCKIVAVGEPVIFNSTIYEPDGYIINYTWDFGDGSYSYTRNATHVYTESGFYKVKFTAMDDDNDTGTKAKWIWVFDGIVDDDYPRDDPANRRWKSIQNAIDHLENNSMIYVYNGTYNESLLINKTIKLYGENNKGVIISNDSVVIDVLSDGSIEIHNFTIRNGITGIRAVNGRGGNIIEDCNLYSNDVGILFDSTSFNNIIRCNITSTSQDIKFANSDYNYIRNCSIRGANSGIYLDGSSWNNIYYCSFRFNDNAVYLYNSDNNIISSCYMEMKRTISLWPPTPIIGIQMVGSDYNLISLCNIFNATDYAIQMSSSTNNHIICCNIWENNAGIYLVGSSHNVVEESHFYNNTMSAITIDRSSRNNSVYCNDFIMNGWGIRGEALQAYDDGESNIWYKAMVDTLFVTTDGEGNYWYDYDGNDTNNDGVGDTPYNISGSAGSQDIYPLIHPCGWKENLERYYDVNWGDRKDPWVRSPVPYIGI